VLYQLLGPDVSMITVMNVREWSIHCTNMNLHINL